MRQLPPWLRRWSLAATGGVLATLPAARLATAGGPGVALLEGGVPLLLLAGVTYAGFVYARRESPAFTAVVTAWTLAVVAGMVVVAAWIATAARIVATPVAFTTLSPVATSVGGVVGLWLGTSNARWRERDAALRRERERTDFLNELLRHYVLNAMQVVIGHAGAISAAVESDSEAAAIAADIDHTSRRVARLIEQLGALAATDVDCWPVDLAAAVEDAAESVESRPDVALTVDAPGTAPVVADDALETLVESLLYHPIDRTEAVDLRVTITRAGEETTLTVVDDAGPPPVETVDPDAIDADDDVFRFQLYLAATLVERYGGDLAVDAVEGGARTTATLPTADDAVFGNP